MSTVPTTIFDAVESQVATTLGGTFSRLRHVLDPTKNDFRSVNKGYGVRRTDAPSAESVMRSFTLDQGFEVLLTDRAIVRNNDEEMQSAISTLYNQASDILKDLINTKAGVASNVLLVSEGSYAEPEFFDENQVVLLRVSFIVRYRESL